MADDEFLISLDNAVERRSTEDTELIDMVEIENTGRVEAEVEGGIGRRLG